MRDGNQPRPEDFPIGSVQSRAAFLGCQQGLRLNPWIQWDSGRARSKVDDTLGAPVRQR